MDQVWTLYTEVAAIHARATGGKPTQWGIAFVGVDGGGHITYSGEVYVVWRTLAEEEERLRTLRDSYRLREPAPE
jgi:hypothetical protein